MRRFVFLILALSLCVTVNAANILLVTDGAYSDSRTGDPEADFTAWLTGLGHTVTNGDGITQYRTANLGAAGAQAYITANSINLVIVSRVTDSGSYNEMAWNDIDVPMLMMSPHLARNTRWDWTRTGSVNQTAETEILIDGAAVPFTTFTTEGRVTYMGSGSYPFNDTKADGGTVVGKFDSIGTLPDTYGAGIIRWEAGVVMQSDYGQVAADKRTLMAAIPYHETVGETALTFDHYAAEGKALIAREINLLMTTSDPEDGEEMVEPDLTAREVPGEVSWTVFDDVTGIAFNVYLGTTEPNELFADYGLPQIAVETTASSAAPSLPLAYGTTYHWVVDVLEPNGLSYDVVNNYQWSFTTAPEDRTPTVTAGSSYITWLANLPQTVDATVDDNGEGDIATVTWEIVSGPGFATAEDMQMIDRAAQLGNIISGDPNLLRDWIGTDSRGVNGANSDVLTLTLSGLPAGTYNWKSYHYDPENQADVFDVTVNDATGSTTTTGVGQSNGAVDPNTFTTTITSDGADVTLVFVGSDDNYGMFTMNGFELTGTGDPLMIDFSRDNDPDTGTGATPIATGFNGYLARHEVPETFTTQAFSAFGTTVSVTPSWDYIPGAEITSTGGTLLASTATIDATTGAPKGSVGTYTIRLTATENDLDGDTPQSASATLEVKVAADACAAAKLNGATVNYYDVDANCIVDLSDFAAMAENWLNDVALTESLAY